MGSERIPLIASILALAWAAAQILESGYLAVLVATACLGAVAGLGVARRGSRGLVMVLATVMVGLATALILLLALPADGPLHFLVQLGLMVTLTPLFPAIYWAFPPGPKVNDEDAE